MNPVVEIRQISELKNYQQINKFLHLYHWMLALSFMQKNGNTYLREMSKYSFVVLVKQ